jgi:hypothetical protein
VLAAGCGATNSFCRAPVVRICQFLLLASMKLGCNVKCVTSTEFLMAQNFVTFRGIGRSRKVSFGAIKIVLSISFFLSHGRTFTSINEKRDVFPFSCSE